jgi:hypothetical protein
MREREEGREREREGNRGDRDVGGNRAVVR